MLMYMSAAAAAADDDDDVSRGKISHD